MAGNPQGLARVMLEGGRGKPAEMLGPQHLSIAAAIIAAGDHRIQRTIFEGFDQHPGIVDDHLHRQAGIERFEPGQQRRHLRPHDMGGDAQPEAAALGRKSRERPFMGRQKLPCRRQKGFPLCRQAHLPGRALDQLLAEPLLQPLQLHADCPLCGAERHRRTGEALKIGDHHEGPDGLDLKRAHLSKSVISDMPCHAIAK